MGKDGDGGGQGWVQEKILEKKQKAGKIGVGVQIFGGKNPKKGKDLGVGAILD